jgi:hypothetical protein
MFQKSPTAAPRALSAIAAFAIASAAGAEDYRWQISGGYGDTELAPFADTERVTLDATYYLDAVDDARGPYALAPFLNRSSRVTAAVTSDETTITSPVFFSALTPPPPGTPTTVTTTEETTGFVIGGRYVWSASGWYVGASYRDADTDQEPGSARFQQGTAIEGYQVFGGRYFGESTSLDLAAGATRQTSELNIVCITALCLSGTAATDIDTDDWSIGALHVRRGTRLTYSIAGRASSASVTPSITEPVLTLPSGAPPPPVLTLPANVAGALNPVPVTPGPFMGPPPVRDERETYSIAGEVFPTDRLGFRIGLSRSHGDFQDDDSYDLAATWFFKRAVAVEFALARTEQELGSFARDVDSAELRLLGRL